MKFSLIIVVQVLLALNFVSHVVEARIAKSTSYKPPIKTFKDEYGSIIDCIDIHKQPALDHPLLKNHKIQTRVSSLPRGVREDAKLNSDGPTRPRAYLGEFRCPYGTVPFMRTKKEASIRPNGLSPHPFHPSSASNSSDITHFAGITTPMRDLSRKFYGAKVETSIYNPTNIVSPQLSESLLWLGSAIDGEYSSLEFGWIVHPQLYGDNRTRTYSLWTGDGHKSTGCYNAQCQGYVQVSRTAYLGAPVVPVSDPGHQVYSMEFFLFNDIKTGNWWLAQTLKTGKYEPVGYWPKELFPSMREFAKVIQIGGKVYIPSSVPGHPQMGSGAFVANDLTRTCYASNIEFVDSDNQFYPPKDVTMEVVADQNEIYTANRMVDNSTSWGYAILFGGPDIRK